MASSSPIIWTLPVRPHAGLGFVQPRLPTTGPDTLTAVGPGYLEIDGTESWPIRGGRLLRASSLSKLHPILGSGDPEIQRSGGDKISNFQNVPAAYCSTTDELEDCAHTLGLYWGASEIGLTRPES